MHGKISLDRKILDWEWWSDQAVSRLWLTILLLANWQDTSWQGQTIKRGSFVTSYATLSAFTGLSIKQVRRGIDCLKRTGEIVQKTTNKNQLIIVAKYDEYQSQGGAQGQAKGCAKGTQRADKGQQLNNNNKYISSNEDIYRGFGFSDPVIDALVDFEEMRKKIKSPLTSERAIRTLCNKLVKLSGGDERIMVAMLNESISQNWKSVYPLKDDAVIEAADQSTEIKERIKELETELTDVEAAMVRATDRHQYGELKLRKSWLEDSIRKLREKIA